MLQWASVTGVGGPRDAGGDTDLGLWLAEHVHRRRDGSEFPASVTVGRLHDVDGRPAGLVVGVRDLTEERRVAERMRQTEKLAALGELVAGVAHELNNPLTGISAFAQLLLEDPLDEEQLDSVKLIKREADRAVAVIRDLLVFSRKTGPRHLDVDVNTLVEQTVRLRAYGLRSAGIDVSLDLDASGPRLLGDDQKLQQVLLNLVVNAEYAMQHAGRRELTLRTRAAAATGIVIEVSDSGAGMSAETLRHVFEPFFTTKPAGVGTGLGLSVSYGIVRAHGGDILVESAPDAGTTFRIVFPSSSTPPGPE
jgi:two-component system NtrC family sensor kinase